MSRAHLIHSRVSLVDAAVLPSRVRVEDDSTPDYPDDIVISFGGFRISTTPTRWRELVVAVEAGLSTIPEQKAVGAAWNVSRGVKA